MGFSVNSLSEPLIYTNKPVGKLSSNIVWVISGEGVSPKLFQLAAVFKVHKVAAGTYEHPDFKNSASGSGIIIKENLLLNHQKWFSNLTQHLRKSRYSLAPIKDGVIVEGLMGILKSNAHDSMGIE